jgi:hypothetical protein
MSQIVPGLLLGYKVYVLRGAYDPNSAPAGLLTEQGTQGDSVALASLFLRYDTGQMYLKTAGISATNPSGAWTEK